MGPDVAAFLAVYGILTEGDILTGTLSIGGKDGLASGLDNHGAFEGDTSLTREDTHLSPIGDGFSFNSTRYAQVKQFAGTYGGGNLTLKALQELRYQRFLDSKADNSEVCCYGISIKNGIAHCQSSLPLLSYVSFSHMEKRPLFSDYSRMVGRNFMSILIRSV